MITRTAAALPRAPLPPPTPREQGSGVSPAARHLLLHAAWRRLLRTLEIGFIVLALFLFSQALVPLLVAKSGQTVTDLREGNAVLRGMFLALQVTAVLLGLMRWRSFLHTALRHKLTLLLVALALISVWWSDAPDVTLRRSIALLGTTAVGVYLADRYPLKSLLYLLASALGITAVLSLVFALLLPDYGISSGSYAGAWRGVFTHKNTLAQVMVLSAVVCFLLWKDATRLRGVLLLGVGLSVALVLLSTSTSALLLLVSLALLVPLLATLRWHPSVLVPTVCFAVVAALAAGTLLLASSEAFVGVFGKDLTFTGRTYIWSAVLTSIAERPWLGHGYSAFWLGSSGGSAQVVERVGFITINSHNGFLDIALDLGTVGLLVFLAGFGLAVARALSLTRGTDRFVAVWPLVFLAFVFLANLTESGILRQNSLLWVLYVATVCSLGAAKQPRSTPGGGRPAAFPDMDRRPLSPGVRFRYRSAVIPHHRTPGATTPPLVS